MGGGGGEGGGGGASRRWASMVAMVSPTRHLFRVRFCLFSLSISLSLSLSLSLVSLYFFLRGGGR